VRAQLERENGHCYALVVISKQTRNRGSRLMRGVSDILIMTLGLLAGVVGCLAKPCKPEQWAHVKATRIDLAAMRSNAPVDDFEVEPASEPGFADGLAAAAA
jgi:hypothetical protein